MSASTIRRSQCLRQKGFFFSCRLFTKAARMTRHCRHSSVSGDVFKFPVSGVVLSILRFLLPVTWEGIPGDAFSSRITPSFRGAQQLSPPSGHRTWKTVISGHPCSPADRCRAWASGPSSTGSPSASASRAAWATRQKACASKSRGRAAPSRPSGTGSRRSFRPSPVSRASPSAKSPFFRTRPASP